MPKNSNSEVCIWQCLFFFSHLCWIGYSGTTRLANTTRSTNFTPFFSTVGKYMCTYFCMRVYEANPYEICSSCNRCNWRRRGSKLKWSRFDLRASSSDNLNSQPTYANQTMGVPHLSGWRRTWLTLPLHHQRLEVLLEVAGAGWFAGSAQMVYWVLAPPWAEWPKYMYWHVLQLAGTCIYSTSGEY